MPEILECIAHVIGPDYKLSSLDARSANPHNAESQPLHVDAGAVADESGYWVCNTIWMLDDFTRENGATRMIPRSHAWRRLPTPGITDSVPDEELVTGKAGTVVIMNTQCGTAERPTEPSAPQGAAWVYTRNDKPQQQYQKALLRCGNRGGTDTVTASGARPRRCRERPAQLQRPPA